MPQDHTVECTACKGTGKTRKGNTCRLCHGSKKVFSPLAKALSSLLKPKESK